MANMIEFSDEVEAEILHHGCMMYPPGANNSRKEWGANDRVFLREFSGPSLIKFLKRMWFSGSLY